MTDKEIIRALRCCAEGECKDCAMHEDTLNVETNMRCDDYNLPYCEQDSYCSHGRRKEETKHAAD